MFRRIAIGVVLVALASACGSGDQAAPGVAPSAIGSTGQPSGGSITGPSDRIVGGVDVPRSLLNVGTLTYKVNKGDAEWRWKGCTGTLIAPDVFLTAGHCLFEWETWGYEVIGVTFAPRMILGSDPWNPIVPADAKVYSGRPIVHPDFAWEPWPDYRTDMHPDFAVILLDKKVTGVVPAVVAPVGFLSAFQPLLAKLDVGMAGYGVTSPAPMLEGTDPDWGTRRYTTGHLVAVYPGSFEVSATPGVGCWMDSGGPLLPALGEVGGRLPPPRSVALVLGLVRDPPAGVPVCTTGTVNTRLDTVLAHRFLDPFLHR